MSFTKCKGNCGKLTCRNDGYCLTCFREREAKNKVEEFKMERVEKVYVTDFYNSAVKPDPENEVNGKKVYYCFQGKQFVHEASAGYIFAGDDDGIHHWARLKELKDGDIIFHGTVQGVLAISVVQGKCFNAQRPKEHLLANDRPFQVGLMVETKYDLLRRAICTVEYIDEIIRLQGNSKGKGYPFNKNGKGNEGYLFNLHKDLAKLFMQEIIKRNPSMAERDYVKAILG